MKRSLGGWGMGDHKRVTTISRVQKDMDGAKDKNFFPFLPYPFSRIVAVEYHGGPHRLHCYNFHTWFSFIIIIIIIMIINFNIIVVAVVVVVGRRGRRCRVLLGTLEPSKGTRNPNRMNVNSAISSNSPLLLSLLLTISSSSSRTTIPTTTSVFICGGGTEVRIISVIIIHGRKRRRQISFPFPSSGSSVLLLLFSLSSSS